MRPLDPSDPIDLAAMQELDALTPAVPPMVPQPTPEELLAKFEVLDRAEQLREATRRRRWQERQTVLEYLLGKNFYPSNRDSGWVSEDGKLRLSRESLDLSEGGGWKNLPAPTSSGGKP